MLRTRVVFNMIREVTSSRGFRVQLSWSVQSDPESAHSDDGMEDWMETCTFEQTKRGSLKELWSFGTLGEWAEPCLEWSFDFHLAMQSCQFLEALPATTFWLVFP